MTACAPAGRGGEARWRSTGYDGNDPLYEKAVAMVRANQRADRAGAAPTGDRQHRAARLQDPSEAAALVSAELTEDRPQLICPEVIA